MNEINLSNFNLIYNRTSHQYLHVKNGLIQELKGIDRLRYLMSSDYKMSVQKDLSQQVAQILKAIDHTIEHSSEETKRIYKIFVFDKLARFNTQIFNREILNKVDCSRLVKLLDEDYQSIDVEADFTQDENYLKKVESVAKFALKLGIRPEKVKEGSSGTYFLKDLSNRNIAVFKPLDEEPLAKDSSKFASQAKRCFLNVIRRIFNCFQTAIFCCSGNAHKAEAAAWLISKHLGLNNVPLTKLTTLESPLLKNMRTQTGSLQVFINKQDLVSAEKLLKIPYFWSSFPQLAQWHFNRESEVKRLEGLISQEEFEKMVIIDIVQGNLDRHQRNWLVAENKIYCIDNGYAMPNKHPQNRFTGKNQYIWSYLPYANQTFSSGSKETIQKIQTLIPSLLQRLQQAKLIDDEQIERMCERVAMLHVKQNLKIREIVKFKSAYDFKMLKSDKKYLEAFNQIKVACRSGT